MRRLLFAVPALVLIFACAKTDQHASPTLEVKLPIQVNDETKLSEIQKKLLEDYRNGTAIDITRWHEGMASLHNVKDYDLILKDVGDLVPQTNNILAVKPAYEKTLSIRRNKPIRYDMLMVNLKSVLELADLQCYSGTLLHTLVTDRTDAGPNRVIIFESGHALPGFMRQENGAWMLYGIETTAKGRALVRYGAFSALSKKQIRVVDIALFRVVESFKFELKNGMEVANLALETTGKFYGGGELFLLQTEPVVANVMNYSPFGFGQSNPRPGPQERSEFDEKVRTDINFIDGGGTVRLYGEECLGFATIYLLELEAIIRSPENRERIAEGREITVREQAIEYANAIQKNQGELNERQAELVTKFIEKYRSKRVGEQPGYGFLPGYYYSGYGYGQYPGSGDEQYYK